MLGTLNQLVKDWVKRITLKRTSSETLAADAGGKIFTLGSYRLGVHQQGADIDTLVLAPKYVTREDFSTDLYDTLCKRPEITRITVRLLFFFGREKKNDVKILIFFFLQNITDAFTPIMNLVFSGIEVRGFSLFRSTEEEKERREKREKKKKEEKKRRKKKKKKKNKKKA